MNTHEPEDLNRLLSDAVGDIEPRSGIEAIRSRTSPMKDSPMAVTRTWFLGAFGAAAATAAVITGVVVLGNDDPSAGRDPGFADTTSASPEPSDDATSEAPTDDPTAVPGSAVPVYWVSETARGLGLYREFTANADGEDPVFFAVTTAVEGSPLDPDYRSGWPADAEVIGAAYDGTAIIEINLNGDVHDRPTGMSEREAQIAIEQLVYTAQGAVGEGRLPVQLLIDGGHTDQVLGQPASEQLANGPVLETLSLVNIDSPAESAVIAGDTLKVSGVANSNEANVLVRLQRYEGNHFAFQKSVTAGWLEEKLFPFSHTFDISDVEPGTYILTAMTDDPSGGAEGFGADVDSKVITIE